MPLNDAQQMEMYGTVKVTSQRLEDLYKRLFGNGQPGIVDDHESRLGEIETAISKKAIKFIESDDSDGLFAFCMRHGWKIATIVASAAGGGVFGYFKHAASMIK